VAGVLRARSAVRHLRAYGGDEFIVLLSDFGDDLARPSASSCRKPSESMRSAWATCARAPDDQHRGGVSRQTAIRTRRCCMWPHTHVRGQSRPEATAGERAVHRAAHEHSGDSPGSPFVTSCGNRAPSAEARRGGRPACVYRPRPPCGLADGAERKPTPSPSPPRHAPERFRWSSG